MEFFWLAAALLLVLVLDSALRGLRRLSPLGRRGAGLAMAAIAVVVLVPLVPSWPYSAAPFRVPAWFTRSHHLPEGSGVVVYPLANPSDGASMVWQAFAHFRFRMPGGYAVFASNTGAATFASRSSSIRDALTLCAAVYSPSWSAEQIHYELQEWSIREVVVVPSAGGAPCAEHLFASVLGAPQAAEGVVSWSLPA
jgi:hypothetical protein